ncbi:MAG: DUF4150 domain-containing protein [bacterium]|nr:DUF4150 domain-containing protein [bacterium]
MFPITTNGGGQCMGFPDVCKTPTPGGPVPIPYPNIAMANQAKGSTTSKKVKVGNKNVCTTKTEISMSSGDEAGNAGGGVVSSKFKGPALYKKGSSKVKAEGTPVVHLTSMIGLNGGSNANMPAGVQVAPSQVKVTVMP